MTRSGGRALVGGVVALLLSVLISGLTIGPARAADLPGAVVVLGDSAAAGDGAGDYAPGTRGEGGDWCHRSTHAYVNRTGLPGEPINLACSGADSADVAFGAPGHYTEGSQAQQLVAVARQYRVTTVVLQVGANDHGSITETGVTCIRAFLDVTEPPCRTTVGPQLAERTRAMAAGVDIAVGDVRAAMRQAGYAEDGYVLVLASYAPPISERMVPLQAGVGCPYSRADAGWGRTVLFPEVSAALRGVADRSGARFLDLDRATEGFEACTRSDPSTEMHRRLTVDPEAFVYGGLDAFAYHLAQESFHPTAAAHERIGRCVGDLVRSGAAAAACATGADGTTRLETGPPADPAAA